MLEKSHRHRKKRRPCDRPRTALYSQEFKCAEAGLAKILEYSAKISSQNPPNFSNCHFRRPIFDNVLFERLEMRGVLSLLRTNHFISYVSLRVAFWVYALTFANFLAS